MLGRISGALCSVCNIYQLYILKKFPSKVFWWYISLLSVTSGIQNYIGYENGDSVFLPWLKLTWIPQKCSNSLGWGWDGINGNGWRGEFEPLLTSWKKQGEKQRNCLVLEKKILNFSKTCILCKLKTLNLNPQGFRKIIVHFHRKICSWFKGISVINWKISQSEERSDDR